MNINATLAACLCALVSLSFGDPPHARSIDDLRTDLTGTSWKAASGKPRPGLAPVLTFTQANVQPEGYAYKVNNHDSLTISFNRGDTQLMLLTPDGKRLKFTFRNREYSYQLVSQ